MTVCFIPLAIRFIHKCYGNHGPIKLGGPHIQRRTSTTHILHLIVTNLVYISRTPCKFLNHVTFQDISFSV
jgi:hypothetical protein